ncbi:unnamed protein product [Adineta steineri]|uniref:Uncharacterized protein n=1 Tax=Adineta steineri TaxID=433720 RepID=A0A819MNS4_9BILA|nr:unnamed protein product [Adineta steineri]CAF3982779.1 unnamed protein product [Adineta steineri]
MESESAIPDYIAAHKHCKNHPPEIENSELCGCFYCLSFFPPNEIDDWCDDGATAVCKCSIDSIIGSASGYPITKEFLLLIKNNWFGNA